LSHEPLAGNHSLRFRQLCVAWESLGSNEGGFLFIILIFMISPKSIESTLALEEVNKMNK